MEGRARGVTQRSDVLASEEDLRARAADIVAVRAEGNPFLTPMYDPLETLVYAGSGGRDVSMTMVDGRIVYMDGEFKTVDADAVIKTVNEASKRIQKAMLC